MHEIGMAPIDPVSGIGAEPGPPELLEFMQPKVLV